MEHRRIGPLASGKSKECANILRIGGYWVRRKERESEGEEGGIENGSFLSNFLSQTLSTVCTRVRKGVGLSAATLEDHYWLDRKVLRLLEVDQ